MQSQIEKLKKEIARLCENPEFIHHEWFVEYHLTIVEQIAMELCDRYPEADSDLIQTVVWMHDCGKMIDFDNEHETTQDMGRDFLIDLGFEQNFVKRVMDVIDIMDKKIDIQNADIEVQVVSSADGASHYVGPFYKMYWYENADKKNWRELMHDNLIKDKKDWERKIVLPEVKRMLQCRRQAHLEHSGQLPDKFLE